MRSSISRAHLFGPRLGAEDPHLQRARGRVEALLLELVDDREHVRRREHDDLGPEVRDQLHLAGRHPAGDGNGGGPEALDAVVRAQPAGEQAVAVGVVHLVTRPDARRAQRTRHQVGPYVDVARGVADDRRPARRARRRVDPPHLVLRHGEHAERVVLAQVGLGGGGELRQVREVAAVVGMHAGRVEKATVVRHVGVGAAQGLLQPRELQGPQLVDRHPLLGVEGVGRRGFPEPAHCSAVFRATKVSTSYRATDSPSWRVTSASQRTSP